MIHEYWQILSDPAHTMVELTFTVVVDGVMLGVLWPFIKRRIHDEHAVIDAEHGIRDHGE